MEVALPVPVGQMTVDLPVVRHFLLLLPGTCINSLGLFCGLVKSVINCEFCNVVSTGASDRIYWSPLDFDGLHG